MTSMIDNFNAVLNGLSIDAQCVDAVRHGHIVTYDLRLGSGARVRNIENRAVEIGLHLRSKVTPLIKPIMSEGVIRVQAVNSYPERIDFEDIYDGKGEGVVPVVLGRTTDSKPLWVDLAKHPHTLVAGETGSGKSVCLHAIIASILKRSDVVLHLSDPKGVEFNRYLDLDNVVSSSYTYEDTVLALKALCEEMENRYSFMKKMRVRSMDELCSYKIVMVIDEVSDLMMQDKETHEFENLLIKLAQKSRAAGIYLVIATQRPSVDVVTGLIKANFPARIAFKVSSKTNSKVILDAPGAEVLVGKGDGILKTSAHDFVRFQGAFI